MRLETPTPKDYKVALAYLSAKTTVIESGYWTDVTALASVTPRELTEATFLREVGWVVLSAGISEIVVRRKFDAISEAFMQWQSAKFISVNALRCIAYASKHFNNQRKLRAITDIARIVADRGFDPFKTALLTNPVNTLMLLPFMGPATSRHLAKNIGLDVAKPDRHLVRLAIAAQYRSVEELCQRISWIVGDSVSVVDTVLWRFSTLSRTHQAAFRFDDAERT